MLIKNFDIILGENNDIIVVVKDSYLPVTPSEKVAKFKLNQPGSLSVFLTLTDEVEFNDINASTFSKIESASSFLLASTVEGQSDPVRLWVCTPE